jgi:hypothetical protein
MSVEAFQGRTIVEFRCGVCGYVWQDARDPSEGR